MIISCSSCGAKYLVDSAQINKGRQVRCARCNFSWFQDSAGVAESCFEVYSKKIIAKRDRQSDKNLPAVYKEKKNFILSVTHELKTPIASSKLFAETILSRDISKEKRDDILDKIIKDQTRLEKLVENILLISKVAEHELHLEIEKVNCREFIESVIKGLDFSESTNFDIDSKIEIRIDRFYFTSVIQNLHENAIKYSKDNEGIVWSVQQTGNSICIQIKDQGIGVPSNQREKIFDLFHRIGDENTRDTKGTGVGLYIVQKIVALLAMQKF